MNLSNLSIPEYIQLREKLEAYVEKHDIGHPQWLVIEDAALALELTEQNIIDLCEDSEDVEYCPAIGIPFMRGMYEFKTIGEYILEYVGEKNGSDS